MVLGLILGKLLCPSPQVSEAVLERRLGAGIGRLVTDEAHRGDVGTVPKQRSRAAAVIGVLLPLSLNWRKRAIIASSECTVPSRPDAGNVQRPKPQRWRRVLVRGGGRGRIQKNFPSLSQTPQISTYATTRTWFFRSVPCAPV
jgi:hypothetical protein